MTSHRSPASVPTSAHGSVQPESDEQKLDGAKQDALKASSHDGTTDKRLITRRRRTRFAPWRHVLITVTVLLLLYGAASYYAGMRAHQELERYVKEVGTVSEFAVNLQEHHSGIWRSEGKLALRYAASSAQQGHPRDAQDEVQHDLLIVHYQILHALMPARVASVRWHAEPSRTAMQGMAQTVTVTPEPSLTGQGDLSWEGRFSSSVAMPQLHIRSQPKVVPVSQDSGSVALTLAAMQGEIQADGHRFQLGLQWPTIAIVGIQPVVQATGVSLVFVRSSEADDDGINRLQVESLQTSSATISGLTLSGRSQSSTISGVSSLGLELNAQLARLSTGVYSFHNVNMTSALTGLNEDAIRRLQRLFRQTAGLQTFDEVQSRQWRIAVRDLVLDGLTFETTQLSAQSAFGNIQAQSRFNLDAVPPGDRGAPSQPVDFKTFVSSDGTLLLRGQGLSPTLTALGLLTGLLVRAPDGVTASYELNGDRLVLNGKPLPGAAVVAIINRILNPLVVVRDDDQGLLDRWLQDYIEGSIPVKPEPEVIPVPSIQDIPQRVDPGKTST